MDVVELAFPWRGLDIADGRSLRRRRMATWCSDRRLRFEKIGRNKEVLDPCVGWTWNRHGHYDSHIPEVFPYITFSEKMSVKELGGSWLACAMVAVAAAGRRWVQCSHAMLRTRITSAAWYGQESNIVGPEV